jgi:hypothetical protein
MKTTYLQFDLEKFAPVLDYKNGIVYAIDKEKQSCILDEYEKNEEISCYYVDDNGNLTSELKNISAEKLCNVVVKFI